MGHILIENIAHNYELTTISQGSYFP